MWRVFMSAALIAALSTPVVAQRTDIIRGTVTSDSGRVVRGATILVTRAPDRTVFSGSSDSTGRYVVSIPQGTGDYLVHISATAFNAYRKRVTRAEGAPATDTVLVVDAKLAPAVAQQLAAVNVQAQKAIPTRFRDAGTRAGAAESFVDDFAGGIPPDLAGDLAAAAATLPGVSPTTGGVSVLGLSASQNITTLNGMAFGGAAIPRALQTSTRVSTSTYDPARGWFGGASTNVEFSGASVFKLRSAYATFDAPPLQLTDPVARGLGQRVTGGITSLGASGPIDNRDQFFYNLAVQAGRRASEPLSLFSADASLLQHAGIAQDSVNRLRTILPAIGLPLGSVNAVSRNTDDVSLVIRLDHDPRSVQSDKPPVRTQALTFFGNWSRTSPAGIGVPFTTASAANRSSAVLGVQTMYSTYFARDYLATLRSAFSYATDQVTPSLGIPSASVLVGSTFPGSDGAFTSLGVGGGAPASNSRRYTWETIGETQLYTRGIETHRVTATADARLDGYALDGSGFDRASFTFNSLADLAAGTPSSFRRVLGTPDRAGAVWNAFASLGDLWRVSRAFRVEYGARLEGNVYTAKPEPNTALASALNVRTDVAPNTWHASPRVGFTWVRRGGGNAGALSINNFGTFNMKPTSYIRGGIGEFRSIMPADLLSDALVSTGAGDRASVVSCVGAAVPAPNWNAYLANSSAVPSACVGGAPSAALTDTAPLIRTVSGRYTAPRSWRANLGYESTYRWLRYSVEATYSLNLNQTGRTDLNFGNRVGFLSSDDQRPVFVPVTSVVASTGVVSPSLARTSSAFGSVLSTHSELRSTSQQLIFTVAPTFEHADQRWVQLAYVLSANRSWLSGFDGSTSGSPLEREWARGPMDARHQLIIRSGLDLDGVALTMFTRISSGLPYTPVIGSDINGDGLVNDRAFIPLNATGADAQLRAKVQALAASSPMARECLAAQRQVMATPQSCTGPWTTSLNAQLSFAPAFLKVGGRQPYIRINLANPLAAIDQLVHGADKVHGWGSPAVADPTLLLVRGFDAASRRFVYDVNPRFANSDASRSMIRSPFRLTLDVRFNLSPDFARQQLERYLGPGRGGRPGPRLTIPMLHQRYAREVSDPYAGILALNDSLLLSRQQVDGLREAQRQYRAKVDSVWRDLAAEFAALGDSYDVAKATDRQERTIGDAREITRLDVKATLGKLLDEQQLRLMPGGVIRMYRSEKPLTVNGRTLYGR